MNKREPRRPDAHLSTPSARRADLDEAMRLHAQGDVAGAEVRYRRLLRAVPQDVNALHFLGVLLFQHGRRDEGVDLVERAVALAPSYMDAWSNLGNLYKQSERLDDAEHAYRRALAIDPRHAAAWNNLGIVLRARHAPAEAVTALCRAVELSPDDAAPYFALGNALRDGGWFVEAAAAYRAASALDPQHTRARYRLGAVLYTMGDHAEAARVFREWLEADHDNAVARHMLAACTGQAVPHRASDAYVRQTFDGFAASFDEVLLERLDYHAPDRLLDALAAVLGSPVPGYDILDAGCGTGLCAPLLKPYARSLTGVDLSPRMLDKARARGGYDALHEAEITAFLDAHHGAFDVIASADTLCYFGDLGPFAAAAREAMRPGGWLVFTVEGDDETATWRIQPHGRYRHSREYIEQVLADTGFTAVHVTAAVLRKELGSEVAGWVVVARTSIARADRSDRDLPRHD